ncbi:MAG: O-acetylserine/cysteine exporter [Devosia sp.]|nr:O-acetylserine/cysteine exporter [Devosia sp.]
MTPRDLLLTLAVVAVWGANFVAISWGVDEVAPLLMTGVRYLLAAVPAVFFIRRPKVRLRLAVAYGLAIGVAQFGLLFTAIKLGMPAGLASLVMQLQAFFTIALAAAFLGERPHRFQVLGGLVAIGGIAAIGLERLDGAAFIPLLLTILAALAWGIGNVLTKRAGRIDMFAFVVWTALVPPLPMLGLSLVFEGPGAIPAALAHITWLGGGSLLFIAYISTLFGYGVWSGLLSRYPANLVVPFTLLVPVFGMAASAMLLGESISPFEIAGSLLVFLGLAVNVFGRNFWTVTARLVGQTADRR